MTTSTIKEITGTREWNKWEHGPVFYISMNLENGDSITLGKKKADAFKVWDTVNYEVVEEGKRWKEVKENLFTNKPRVNSENNYWAMIGMAYKLAFELVYKTDADFQNAILLANSIVDQALITYGRINQDNGSEWESAKWDDLPF